MIKTYLEQLKEHILEYNTYFDNGYADVIQDYRGIIRNKQPIFPQDTLGNYFYLRLPSDVQFDNSAQYNISDCSNGFGISAVIVLVAIVNGANADILFDNMLSTVSRWKGLNLRFTRGLFQSDLVVAQELSKISKEDLQTALQRLREDQTMISLQFTATAAFNAQKLNCITDPCICS